jgi:tetratricopeptide (TPR) repeat protein
VNTSAPPIEALRRAVARRPGDLDAHVALAVALAERDAPDASEAVQHAIDALVRAYVVEDPTLDAAVDKAFDALDAGIVRAVGPRQGSIIAISRGLIVFRRDGPEAAAASLPRVEALLADVGDAPSAALTRAAAADLAVAANRPELALRWLEPVGPVGPGFAPLVAKAETMLGRHADGIARCEAALRDLESSAGDATDKRDLECELLAVLANAAMAENDLERATAALERGLALAPERVDLLAASSSLYAMKGQPAVALGIVDGLIARGLRGFDAWRAQLLESLRG